MYVVALTVKLLLHTNKQAVIIQKAERELE